MNKTILENEYITRKEFVTTTREIKDVLNIVKSSVANIEAGINTYSDMYEINKWNSNKLANRVSRLEKHNGITPPQELLISGM